MSRSRFALLLIALALVPSNGVFGAPQQHPGDGSVQPSNENAGDKGAHGHGSSGYVLILITTPVGFLTDLFRSPETRSLPSLPSQFPSRFRLGLHLGHLHLRPRLGHLHLRFRLCQFHLRMRMGKLPRMGQLPLNIRLRERAFCSGKLRLCHLHLRLRLRQLRLRFRMGNVP